MAQGGNLKGSIISGNVKEDVLRHFREQQTEQMRKLNNNTPQDNSLRILMLGKTGHGKSASGNTILSESKGEFVDQIFEDDVSSASATDRLKKVTCQIQGRNITVVDTPGMCDTKKETDVVLREIASAVENSAEGYDVFLFVMRYPTKLTGEEIKTVEEFEFLFGNTGLSYAMALFTHKANFVHYQRQRQSQGKKVLPFEEEIYSDELSGEPDSMGSLLKRNCRGGVVLFENHESDYKERDKMVSSLIEKIEELKKKNGYKRFDNHIFAHARKLQLEAERNERLTNAERKATVREGTYLYLKKVIRDKKCILL